MAKLLPSGCANRPPTSTDNDHCFCASRVLLGERRCPVQCELELFSVTCGDELIHSDVHGRPLMWIVYPGQDL